MITSTKTCDFCGVELALPQSLNQLQNQAALSQLGQPSNQSPSNTQILLRGTYADACELCVAQLIAFKQSKSLRIPVKKPKYAVEEISMTQWRVAWADIIVADFYGSDGHDNATKFAEAKNSACQ